MMNDAHWYCHDGWLVDLFKRNDVLFGGLYRHSASVEVHFNVSLLFLNFSRLGPIPTFDYWSLQYFPLISDLFIYLFIYLHGTVVCLSCSNSSGPSRSPRPSVDPLVCVQHRNKAPIYTTDRRYKLYWYNYCIIWWLSRMRSNPFLIQNISHFTRDGSRTRLEEGSGEWGATVSNASHIVQYIHCKRNGWG